MACPFFMPTEKIEGGPWPHPARLPLGAGWRGLCCAPEGRLVEPNEQDVAENCNLGYSRCERIPAHRAFDAVRFSVANSSSDAVILLNYVCEREHRPGEFGQLEFKVSSGKWAREHSDSCVQRMAQCYVDEYLKRQRNA